MPRSSSIMTDPEKQAVPISKYEPFTEFYLHPGEGTSAVISPILLKGDNYEEWSRSVRNNLRAKNKLGFIDGTIAIPTDKSPDYTQWGIVNSMLVAWIYNTLDVYVGLLCVFLIMLNCCGMTYVIAIL